MNQVQAIDHAILEIARIQADFDELIRQSNAITHLDQCCDWQLEDCLNGRR